MSANVSYFIAKDVLSLSKVEKLKFKKLILKLKVLDPRDVFFILF